MHFYDTSSQTERKKQFASLTSEHLKGKFSATGEWLLPEMDMGMREFMWCTNALLTTETAENVTLANRIIQRNLPGYRHCHFMTFCIAQSIWHFEPLLAPETLSAMDTYFLQWVDSFKGFGMDFVGANDNFPCMATATMLFAGQRYGREDCMALVEKRLRQLRAMQKRSDFPSEYNSPTYTGVSLIALAEIAEHVPDTLKELALAAEGWFWRDLLVHFHLPTAQLAPPYARAYPIDYTACTHHARFAYWALFGDKLPVTPLETIGIPEKGLPGMILHHDPDFLRISCVWALLPTYHCPAALAKEALHRTYPCTITGKADPAYWINLSSPFKDLPAPHEPKVSYQGVGFQGSQITTYMTDMYAMGSSLYPFLCGDQTSSLQVNYVKNPPAQKQEDVKTIFTRYVVNDRPIDWTSSSFVDYGQKICIQYENTSLSAWWPSPANNTGITSLRLTVNISALYELPDEVWLGNTKMEGLTGETGTETVFVRDGKFAMAFTPILFGGNPDMYRVRVKPFNRVLEISFVSYEGEETDFPRDTLMNTGCALLMTVESLDSEDAFATFRQSWQPKIGTLHRTDTHHIACETPKAILGMQFSPYTRTVRWTEASPHTGDYDGLMTWDLL